MSAVGGISRASPRGRYIRIASIPLNWVYIRNAEINELSAITAKRKKHE